MSQEEILFSGQGEISLHTRTNGLPDAGQLLGDTNNFKVTTSTEVEDHLEKRSGNRLTNGRLQKANKVNVSFDLENWTKENLAIGLYATIVAGGAGTVTAELMPNPLEIDKRVILAHQNVSSVVVTDSTGSPKTLPAGQYEVSAKPGSIVFTDITSGAPYVLPFKAAYSYAEMSWLTMFTQTIPERWLRFEGVNTGHNNDPVVVDLYRVSFDPFSDLSLINDSYASIPLAGSALYDSTKADSGAFGRFGRMALFNT